MKNYRALVGAILRFAVIAGMWIWFFWVSNHTTGMGSLGLVALIPPMLVFETVLFIGAVLRIGDYRLSVRWARGDVTENTPRVKSRKNPISIAVQSALIFAAAVLLFGLGWIGFWEDLAIIAVFIVLKLVDK